MTKDMTKGDTSEPLMTVAEVARMLHVHNNTVRRWSDQRLIKAYRVSRRGDRRYRRQDIIDFLAGFNKWSEDEGEPTVPDNEQQACE